MVIIRSETMIVIFVLYSRTQKPSSVDNKCPVRTHLMSTHFKSTSLHCASPDLMSCGIHEVKHVYTFSAMLFRAFFMDAAVNFQSKPYNAVYVPLRP